MHQFERTPGIWQHPTPQQTFPEVESGKPKHDYLRQRLRSLPPEKDVSSEPATVDVAAAFFSRLNKPAQTVKPNTNFLHLTPATISSSGSAEDLSLLDKLKREYSLYAAELHEETVNRLQGVHSKLGAVASSTRDQDEAFLAAITGKKSLVRSLNACRTQYECIDEKTGRKSTEVASIGECIGSSAKRLTVLETEVQQLWDQWEIAQNEILSILGEMASKEVRGGHHQNGDVNGIPILSATTYAEFNKDFKDMEMEWEHMAQSFMKKAKATENNAYKAGCGAIAGLVQQKMLAD